MTTVLETREGAPVVASAGNDQTDACLFTPAWIPLAITVSATNIIDELYISTNNGECVDMLAPGEEVYLRILEEEKLSWLLTM